MYCHSQTYLESDTIGFISIRQILEEVPDSESIASLISGLVVTLTFDLLTSSSNQFICYMQVVNSVKFSRVAC